LAHYVAKEKKIRAQVSSLWGRATRPCVPQPPENPMSIGISMHVDELSFCANMRNGKHLIIGRSPPPPPPPLIWHVPKVR
jgi:hypothetical protein